jgi:hypothetical protein
MESDEYDFGFGDGCILLEDVVKKCLMSCQDINEFKERFDQETRAVTCWYVAERAVTLRARLE